MKLTFQTFLLMACFRVFASHLAGNPTISKSVTVTAKSVTAKSVTVTEGTNIAATVSPDHKTIVVDLQGTLWSLPITGGAAKKLTDPFLEAARPDYSPAGGVIAFQAYKGGTFHIWTTKPDGSALQQLTDGHGDDREPRFSPDGSKIAFSSDRAFKGSYDIWVVDVASKKLTQWTANAADEFEPTWSADGSELAYISGVGVNGTKIMAGKHGAEHRTLVSAHGGVHFNSPSWSADDKHLAYTEFDQGKSYLNVDGKRLGTADDVFPFYPAWLANDRLLYTANGKINTITVSGSSPRTIPFSAQFTIDRPSYKRKITDFDKSDPKLAKGIVSPALSPDGKRVVFQALNQLWLLEIGGKPEKLTDDNFYKEDPSWSPDGKRIAYSSDKAGTEDLYVLDIATKKEKRVTTSASSAEVSSAWSRDGKALAFQDQAGATYVVELASGKQKQIIKAQFAPSKPTWSANGKTISIGAVKPYTRRYREGTSQILSADVQTGSLTYTETLPFKSLSTRGEDGPIYSPDGKYVAFVVESTLWIRPVDSNGIPTGEARQITKEVTDAPTWSGDSKQLLYLSNGKLRLTGIDGATAKTIEASVEWTPQQSPERTLIHAGRFWSGQGPAEQTNVDILITGGRIRSVRPHRQSASKDENTRYIDASTKSIVPGLWEAHTHEYISGKFYGDRLGRLWLSFGVTSLQSQGDPAYRAIETRESFASGARVGPRFFATGEAIDGERVYYNFMRPTTSEAQLQLELSRAKALGYDNLKSYVRLPHIMQRKVAVFGHQQMGVTTASHYMMPGLGYGVDGMSHISATARLGYAYTRSLGGKSYQDMRSLFAAAGEYVISTPFTSFPLYAEDPALIDDKRIKVLNTPWDSAVLRYKQELSLGKHPAPPEGAHAMPGDLNVTRASLKSEMETVGAILHSGGVVLAGTDSPLDNVATALHLNLRAQVKYGLKPWEALQTATILPARTFGVSKDLGTLEPGKLADLVIVSGDPLKNIQDLAKVQSVMKNGHLYSVAELLAPFEN